MAITLQIPNRLLLELGKGGINFNSNIHKLILLAPSFVFNPASHGTYAEVISGTNYELPTANGYTVGGFTLSPIEVGGSYWYQDNTNNKGTLGWSNLTVTATGELVFAHAVVYDDTHANDVVVGYIGLNETVTLPSGEIFIFEELGFDLTMAAS